jgi:hypothetical protein
MKENIASNAFNSQYMLSHTYVVTHIMYRIAIFSHPLAGLELAMFGSRCECVATELLFVFLCMLKFTMTMHIKSRVAAAAARRRGAVVIASA